MTDGDAAPVVCRLEISGRVQGVSYRASMADQARALGIVGWVRNRRNGSVEAVVAGPADRVEQLIAWAWRGPVLARVDDVRIHADADSDGGFDGFEFRPTV